jgi:hypothetical protein
VYVLGYNKNDHGIYSVVLDGRAPELFDGISGCGGAFGMTCEQMKPTLAYFASNLDSGPHNLSITNIAGVNNSYFGALASAYSFLFVSLIGLFACL